MAHASTQHKPRYHGLRVTREEYLDLEPDGFSYDMIGGVLYVSPSGHFQHGRTYGNFYALLSAFLRSSPLGEASQETDILLPDGGDVLRPDVCFLLNEHKPMIKTHVHGTPDLVCEVLSDSTAARDLGEKADRYLKNGVKEYWILDPADATMRLWWNEGSGWLKQEGGRLESRLLPGFIVEKKDIF